MVDAILENLIRNLTVRSNEITELRKIVLNSLAEYIVGKKRNGLKVNLIFICTHNSRRSHMSQIWAQTAAEYYEIENVSCYSGGTEATAFNPRSVKTIRDAGFKVVQKDGADNPVYQVYFSEEKEPLQCFSKVYDDESNPQKDFAAVMTCSHADENCPIVSGAEIRFTIWYDDPKEFDGTEFEELKYKDRFEQIGIEMLYIFKQISYKCKNE